MGPRQGALNFNIDSDALLAGWLRLDGRHVVVLAVSGLGFTTNYIRSEYGRVLLKSRNDSGKPQSHRALVATGLDWHSATGAAFDAARTLLRQRGVTEENAPPEIDPLWRESWYDGLGYCTWNSLGRELTQDRVLDALQDLHDKGVFVSTVIIDDNWQSLDAKRRWDKFEANEHFPNGLKGLTSEIRRRFKHIAHIAVWHAIVGYWEGVSPDGWIASNYKCTTVKWRGGHKVTVVDETDVNRMYNDFYRFLKSSGVDSVKCDVQSALSDFDHAVDRKRLGHAYQDAFKVNGLRYFQARVIYCMAMIPDTFFHSLLQHRGPTVLLRNSDGQYMYPSHQWRQREAQRDTDFYPDIPDSHPWHLFCNAMNNIYTSFLNVLPDWDMFQTSLPEYAGLHAAGRCISGGCIYITDTPGKHSLPLIKQMGATSIRAPERLVALRPSAASIPLDPYMAYNSNRLLKVCSIYGAVSMMAVFNVSTNENSELISLHDFKNIVDEQHYVVRAQTTGEVFGPATTVSDGVLVFLTLQVAGWELLSAVPVTKRGDFDVGVIGLVSQLAGAAAVTQSWIGDDGTLTKVQVQLKALGTLGTPSLNTPPPPPPPLAALTSPSKVSTSPTSKTEASTTCLSFLLDFRCRCTRCRRARATRGCSRSMWWPRGRSWVCKRSGAMRLRCSFSCSVRMQHCKRDCFRRFSWRHEMELGKLRDLPIAVVSGEMERVDEFEFYLPPCHPALPSRLVTPG